MRLLVLPAVGAIVVACATGDSPTSPPRSAAAGATPGRGSLVSGVTGLLLCQAADSATATAVIGPEGGVLRAAGHRISVPAGAVPEPTTFVVTAPAGRYVEVDVSAVGVEHYTFLRPVTITLDVGRCPLSLGPLRAWYIDEGSKALLEDMGGATNLLSRTHTFQTGHLSGYAVAT